VFLPTYFILNPLLTVKKDVHHGNGTEEIVAGNENILFVSSYVNKIYPMTGVRKYVGDEENRFF
jgi:acetoin utilization deacetylase AcuC-like enzyme